MSDVLVLNFFPAFTPASSGGELRFGKLYRALSKMHRITMLTSTDFGARFEEIEHTPTLRELRFPKDDLWREAYAALERLDVQGDLAGLAFSLAVNEPKCALRAMARQLAQTSDLVIHEFPYSEPIFNDGCPVREIYNSHNFEASLLSSIVTGNGFDQALLKLIRLEGNLVSRAAHVYATSHDDAEKFRLFYGASRAKISICPNGFDDLELRPIANARLDPASTIPSRPNLLFFGSGHHPNVEAAAFLLKIAPDLPACDIIIAGGVCKAIAEQNIPANVTLFGPFDAAAKARLLREASLFINPVTLGSGTSLKALEALGAHLPMVSTPEGVRGLGLTHGTHCEIASRAQFTTAIQLALNDETYRNFLAASGIEIAQQQFSWDRIATNLNETMFGGAQETPPEKPFILGINDFAVLEAGSGGIARVRCLSAYNYCDTVLISFGTAFEAIFISPTVLHVTIPKTPAHQSFEDAINSGQEMSVNDAAASLFAASNYVLTELAANISRRAQAVIFEHPYMAPLLDTILVANPAIPIVYNAHNVEATHKNEILRAHSLRNTLVAFITELERQLVSHASLITCCTEADAQYFRSAGASAVIIPNGCTLPALSGKPMPHGDTVPRAGFLGSGHGPNVEAAKFIIDELVPIFPDVHFEFIGSVCGTLPDVLPENVIRHGVVTEQTKTDILESWNIALNPIESGGGSSLKLPDYLAHGIASISTPAGARGFEIAENDSGAVVIRSKFVSTLMRMLNNPNETTAQGARARRYAVNHLSWESVTKPYRESLKQILTAPPELQPRPKLLVVTYRYTEPSLGGAEEYLIEILKTLRPRFEHIDLATIDIDQLTNHHHFACQFSTPPGGAARRVAALFDRSFYFEAESPPEIVMLARSRDLERSWANEELTLLAPFAAYLSAANQLRLFGGFFWPENHSGTIRRWTSPQFSFLLPAQACSFRMSGYASADKNLHVTLLHVAPDGTMTPLVRHSQKLSARFFVNLTLPRRHQQQSLVLHCEVDEHIVAGDHRPFGVLLESAAVLQDYHGHAPDDDAISELSYNPADLSALIEEELRVEQFEPWVAALHHTAANRTTAMETDFAAVRGPHAPKLCAWLTEHAANYDAVLVQGIPFDIIPSAVETLNALPKRPHLVTLPHFHGDDRFYHWRRYYESFAAADANLLFSSAIAAQLGGGHYKVVPGGGVQLEEQTDIFAESRFREVYRHTAPFFLVLGRKTASKGYQQAIRAHQVLRKSGVEIDLLLIGPDEDGIPLHGDGVHYLGRQPRAIVRGALTACLGLVTMSQSESFGIVLCEAWLFGKPVIANRACYSFRELVQDNETGLLVSDEAELAGAMRSLSTDPARRIKMGEAGYKEVLKTFSWGKVASAIFDTLNA